MAFLCRATQTCIPRTSMIFLISVHSNSGIVYGLHRSVAAPSIRTYVIYIYIYFVSSQARHLLNVLETYYTRWDNTWRNFNRRMILFHVSCISYREKGKSNPSLWKNIFQFVFSRNVSVTFPFPRFRIVISRSCGKR